MPRAIGVSLAPDTFAGPLTPRPVGVFLESAHGAYMEYRFSDAVENSDLDAYGFVEHRNAVEDLGDLMTWWKTLGVQDEVGLFPDLVAEVGGQLFTPREWLSGIRSTSRILVRKMFAISTAPSDDITVEELSAIVSPETMMEWSSCLNQVNGYRVGR